MGRYRDALKKVENTETGSLINLKNPLDSSSLGFLGTPPAHFENNQAANDENDQAESRACFAWLIHFTDRNPMAATFSPMVDHAGALACYPDAVAAEPIPDIPSRTPTDEESARLAMLMTVIYGDDSEDEQAEALQAALADPDNALACYTAMASERGLILPGDDDRRTCRQCANLRGGVCVVACPGGAVSAVIGYRPGPMFREHPHRCEGYSL
jgi:hypothetical protein